MNQGTFYARTMSKMYEEVEKMKTVCQKIALAITALSMVFVAETAFAQGPEGPEQPARPPKGEFIQKMVDELDLTEQQVQQITKNKQESDQQNKLLREKMKQARDAIRTELIKDTTNEKALKRLANELKTVQAEMVDQHIKSLLEVKKILTPEQFKQFNEKMEQKRGKFSQFRGKMQERWNERSKPCPEQE